jgi:hypothetical protein
MFGVLTRGEMGRRIVADIHPCDLSLIEKFSRKWQGLDVYIRKDTNECMAVALNGAEVQAAMSGKSIEATNPLFERNMYDYYYNKNTGETLGKVELLVPDEYYPGGSKQDDLEIAFWWFVGTPEDVPVTEQDTATPLELMKTIELPMVASESPITTPASMPAASYADTNGEPFIRVFHRYF